MKLVQNRLNVMKMANVNANLDTMERNVINARRTFGKQTKRMAKCNVRTANAITLVRNHFNVMEMANVNVNLDTLEIIVMSVLLRSTCQALSFQSVKVYQVRYFLPFSNLIKGLVQKIVTKNNTEELSQISNICLPLHCLV